MGSTEDDPYMVAAIDFGTTRSSYAFSYRHDFLKDPLNIKTTVWPGSMDLYTPKAPTVVLLDANLQFEAFGYEAEDIYADKATDKEHENCHLFQNITLQFSNPDVDIPSDWMIPDTHENEAPALVVFSAVFAFYQKHLQNTLVNHTGHNETHPVRWVILVPTTWNDSVREFLLSAALEAGFDGEHVFLADASEMVLLYNRYLKPQNSVHQPGKRVMVVDLGGGGVETTVYEITGKTEIEISHKQYHTSLGSRILNDLLLVFLSDLFNVAYEDLLSSLKTHFTDYLDLLRNFEAIKRLVGDDSPKAVTLKLPLSFKQQVEEMTGMTLEEAITTVQLDSVMAIVKGNLRMDRKMINMIFREFINQIINIICKLDEEFTDNNTEIAHILIAGGFSECKLFQSEITKRVNKVQKIDDSGIAALKGAVIYGHDLESLVCLNMTGNTTYSFDEFVIASGSGGELPEETEEPIETIELLLQAGLRNLQQDYEEDLQKLGEIATGEQSEIDEESNDEGGQDSDNGANPVGQFVVAKRIGAEAKMQSQENIQQLEEEVMAINNDELDELQREREAAEAQSQLEVEAQRQRDAEAQKQREAEAEAQRQREAEAKRQREAEAQRQREVEAQRQREAEAQKQREAEAQRQREAEIQKQKDAEAQRQRKAEFQRQLEAELQRQRVAEAEKRKKKSSVCVIL